MNEVKKNVLKVVSKLQDHLKEHGNDIESIIVISSSKKGLLATVAGSSDRLAQSFAGLKQTNPKTFTFIAERLEASANWVQNPFENVKSAADFLEFLGKATKDALPEDLAALISLVSQMFDAAALPVPVSIREANTPEELLIASIENKGLLSEAFEAVSNES